MKPTAKKEKANTILSDVEKKWYDIEIPRHTVRPGVDQARLVNKTTRNPLLKMWYYCADTKKENPGVFMLHDEIWNKITPDFPKRKVLKDGVWVEISWGILSIEAAQERCRKYHNPKGLDMDSFTDASCNDVVRFRPIDWGDACWDV